MLGIVGDSAAGKTTLTAGIAQILGPERVAITGPNGSGKTTLLDLIAGRIVPSGGTVECAVPLALLAQRARLLLLLMAVMTC